MLLQATTCTGQRVMFRELCILSLDARGALQRAVEIPIAEACSSPFFTEPVHHPDRKTVLSLGLIDDRNAWCADLPAILDRIKPAVAGWPSDRMCCSCCTCRSVSTWRTRWKKRMSNPGSHSRRWVNWSSCRAPCRRAGTHGAGRIKGLRLRRRVPGRTTFWSTGGWPRSGRVQSFQKRQKNVSNRGLQVMQQSPSFSSYEQQCYLHNWNAEKPYVSNRQGTYRH